MLKTSGAKPPDSGALFSRRGTLISHCPRRSDVDVVQVEAVVLYFGTLCAMPESGLTPEAIATAECGKFTTKMAATRRFLGMAGVLLSRIPWVQVRTKL